MITEEDDNFLQLLTIEHKNHQHEEKQESLLYSAKQR